MAAASTSTHLRALCSLGGERRNGHRQRYPLGCGTELSFRALGASAPRRTRSASLLRASWSWHGKARKNTASVRSGTPPGLGQRLARGEIAQKGRFG